MRHDPASDFRNTLIKVLTVGYQVPDAEASQIAAQVSERYLSYVDVGSKHFELLNVTLKWHAFCGGVVEGDVAFSEGCFAGVPLIGALRWFDRMRYYYQFNANWHYPHREDIDLDHVEAATCMALWKQEAEAQPYSPDDTPEALLKRVNEILNETAFGTIDKQRLDEAMERLTVLRCLTPRAGWYRLREEMNYQVPEE